MFRALNIHQCQKLLRGRINLALKDKTSCLNQTVAVVQGLSLHCCQTSHAADHFHASLKAKWDIASNNNFPKAHYNNYDIFQKLQFLRRSQKIVFAPLKLLFYFPVCVAFNITFCLEIVSKLNSVQCNLSLTFITAKYK